MELKALCVSLYSDTIDFEDMKKHMTFWNNSEAEPEPQSMYSFVPFLLPQYFKDVGRLIYLDADVVVKVSKLYFNFLVLLCWTIPIEKAFKANLYEDMCMLGLAVDLEAGLPWPELFRTYFYGVFTLIVIGREKKFMTCKKLENLNGTIVLLWWLFHWMFLWVTILILQGNIEELMHIDLENKAIAAVEDCSQKLETYFDLDRLAKIQARPEKPAWVPAEPINPNACGLNEGVLVIDTNPWNKQQVTKAIFWWMDEFRSADSALYKYVSIWNPACIKQKIDPTRFWRDTFALFSLIQ